MQFTNRVVEKRSTKMQARNQEQSIADFAARVRVNQQKLASELKSHYDFIVCGSGTSGSVVAARLAADPNTHVLLLEAGGADETDLVTNPNRWPMTLGSELDWSFVTQWVRSWVAVPASMSRHGLVDTEPIGTSTHPNRTIHLGATPPFWISTAAVLRPGLEAPIRITAGRTEKCTCSRRQIHTRSLWPYSKALKVWGWNDSRIRMVK